MTIFGDALAKIAEVNDLFRSGISCANLSFVKTERSAFLSFTKPTNGSTILEDVATIHATKFEERKESTIGNCRTNLQTPTRIPVGR